MLRAWQMGLRCRCVCVCACVCVWEGAVRVGVGEGAYVGRSTTRHLLSNVLPLELEVINI